MDPQGTLAAQGQPEIPEGRFPLIAPRYVGRQWEEKQFAKPLPFTNPDWDAAFGKNTAPAAAPAPSAKQLEEAAAATKSGGGVSAVSPVGSGSSSRTF